MLISQTVNRSAYCIFTTDYVQCPNTHGAAVYTFSRIVQHSFWSIGNTKLLVKQTQDNLSGPSLYISYPILRLPFRDATCVIGE